MELNDKLKLAFQKISLADNILLVSHTAPDPDALASLGAMLEMLAILGIKNIAYAEKKIDSAYSFIPHEEDISNHKPENLDGFSVILILDCGSISRTGLEPELRAALKARNLTEPKRPYIIEFDHHESQDNFADLEIRMQSKASTTEIVYDFLRVNDFTINKTIADCILTGLISDTGNFLHANSSFDALAASSYLLLKGASLVKISSQLRGIGSLAALKIWGKVFNNIKFNHETGLISSALLKKDLTELLTPEERIKMTDIFGDIVSFMSYLSGVEVALLLREDDGRVKGSLRTNYNEVDVSLIAKNFGGGGHKRAAGFSIDGSLEETEDGWKVV
ncbi:MAG: bifunctional oligoribonuclease/PAP phosphatase NrnA [Patescibacteria group bacterium]|jgi:phosphoesterase RecJ-like protein